MLRAQSVPPFVPLLQLRAISLTLLVPLLLLNHLRSFSFVCGWGETSNFLVSGAHPHFPLENIHCPVRLWGTNVGPTDYAHIATFFLGHVSRPPSQNTPARI